MSKQKMLYWLGVHTLILTMVVLLYILYTLIYPFKIVTLNKSPFQVDKTTYRAGDVIGYELNFTKYMNIKPKISYHLVDGFIYELSNTGVSRPVGTHKYNLSLVLPKTTPPGRYHLQIDLEYEINSFRKIEYSWLSEEFDVKGR